MQYGLFAQMFPLTAEVLAAEPDGPTARFVEAALTDTDARVSRGDSVTPAFLLAAFLWAPARRYASWLQDEGMGEATALQHALAVVRSESIKSVTIPRRFSIPLREIVQLQTRFRYRHGKRAFRLLEHPRFRAAWDFLKLRVQAGEVASGAFDYWDKVQNASEEERRKMLTSQSKRRRRQKK